MRLVEHEMGLVGPVMELHAQFGERRGESGQFGDVLSRPTRIDEVRVSF
jgi:hypothetical protein